MRITIYNLLVLDKIEAVALFTRVVKKIIGKGLTDDKCSVVF